MNTFSKKLLLLAAMAMFSVVTVPVAAVAQSSAAQDAQSQAQDAQQQSADAMNTAQQSSVDSRLQAISDKLNLSDDQKTKLKPILQDEASQLKALKSDTSMTSDQKMDKAKEIRASHKSQIDAILTPEQQQKWQQMKDQAVENKMGQHEKQEPH